MSVLVLFCCTALINIVSGASTEEYKRLQKSLMVNYSNSVRPVLDQNRTVFVKTAYYLADINELDAVGQRLVTTAVLEVMWLDEFLRWDLNSTGIKTLYFKQVNRLSMSSSFYITIIIDFKQRHKYGK